MILGRVGCGAVDPLWLLADEETEVADGISTISTLMTAG